MADLGATSRADRQPDAGAEQGGEHHAVRNDGGEEISAHESNGDALVYVLDGRQADYRRKEYIAGRGRRW